MSPLLDGASRCGLIGIVMALAGGIIDIIVISICPLLSQKSHRQCQPTRLDTLNPQVG